MTAPQNPRVTQADKQAAEAFWMVHGPFAWGTVATLYEAFARHRTTALAAKEAEIAELREVVGLLEAYLDDDYEPDASLKKRARATLAAQDVETAELRAKVERLREALLMFVECARYQPHMSGNHSFMGWNQSDLRRAESHARTILAETQP